MCLADSKALQNPPLVELNRTGRLQEAFYHPQTALKTAGQEISRPGGCSSISCVRMNRHGSAGHAHGEARSCPGARSSVTLWGKITNFCASSSPARCGYGEKGAMKALAAQRPRSSPARAGPAHPGAASRNSWAFVAGQAARTETHFVVFCFFFCLFFVTNRAAQPSRRSGSG